ncbi:MAG: hypothetical protein QXM75_00775 [Candidatus Diapherotrites archaeon]
MVKKIIGNSVTHGKRGMHELMTAFFLVVLVVSVVLMLIYFNYQGAIIQSGMTDQIYKMRYYTTLKNQIENCLKAYEKGITEIIISDLNKCIPKEAKGYSIERIANYDCNYGYFETGDNDNCETHLIFYTNMPQESGKSCLAKLRVCIGTYQKPIAIKTPKETVVLATPGETTTITPTIPPTWPTGPTTTLSPSPGFSPEETPPQVPTATTANSPVATLTPYETDCIKLVSNAKSDEALDIVIISSNFNNKTEFLAKANELSQHILGIEPFASNKNKINFFAVFVTSNLGCSYHPTINRLLVCNWALSQNEASRCASFDRAIVLHREDKYGGSAQFWGKLSVSFCGIHVGSSGTRYTEIWKDVAVHELGHTLGLLDEYISNPNDSASSVVSWLQSKSWPIPPYMQTGTTAWNCSVGNCSEWSGLTNIQCTKGCSLSEWYRPNPSGTMMYDLRGGFSEPSARMIKKALEYFAGG